MILRVLYSIALLGFLNVPLSAQDTPKAELFGGFSMLSPGVDHLYGWDASLAGNFNSMFSVVGDIAGYYRSEIVGGTPFDARVHSFMGGPRMSFRGGRVSGFVHYLAGVVNARGSFSGVGATFNGFQMATGGGIDLKAGSRVSFRVIQFDLVTSRLFGEWGNDIRFGFGVVFPIGK